MRDQAVREDTGVEASWRGEGDRVDLDYEDYH